MLAVSAQINLSRPVIVMCKVHRFVYSWTCWALSWCKKLWKKGWLSSRQWCTTSCPTSEKSRRWMQFFLDVTTRKNKVRARPSASINTWSCGGLCNLHRLTMKQQGMTARCVDRTIELDWDDCWIFYPASCQWVDARVKQHGDDNSTTFH